MYQHFRHRAAPGLDGLWVVTMVSNPQRYRSRYDLYQRFKTGVERVGANLFTAELALGDRPFELTEPGNPRHLQLRTDHELWHKENCLNLAVERLPRDWRYVAWVDADVEIVRHDWPAEVCHQLQHYDVIQLFDTAVDLGPTGAAGRPHQGFVAAWQRGVPIVEAPTAYYTTRGHPGYAWAMRRTAWDALGGLLDTALLGAADRHMAWSLVGRGLETVSPQLTPAYRRHVATWQDRATAHVRQNIGHMPGTLLHHFHGPKAKRFYHDRWQILLRHQYDPDRDLQRDWQGLWRLSDAGLRMRNDLRAYFAARDEDNPNP